MPSVIDDIKQSKGYILGVISFATAVGAFLTQVMHFALEPTVASVFGLAAMILYMGFLMRRSEERQCKALKEHEVVSQGEIQKFVDILKKIENDGIENQRSLMRLEMDNLMAREPYNHDTIIAYAERYFLDLNGDWKQTDRFLNWVEKENEAGRPVHIPPELFSNVHIKHTRERINEVNGEV